MQWKGSFLDEDWKWYKEKCIISNIHWSLSRFEWGSRESLMEGLAMVSAYCVFGSFRWSTRLNGGVLSIKWTPLSIKSFSFSHFFFDYMFIWHPIFIRDRAHAHSLCQRFFLFFNILWQYHTYILDYMERSNIKRKEKRLMWNTLFRRTWRGGMFVSCLCSYSGSIRSDE